MKSAYIKGRIELCLILSLFTYSIAGAQQLGGASSSAADTVSSGTVTTTTKVKVERILKPANERAYDITDHMTTDLKLTDEQARKVYLINLEAAQKMDQIRKQYRKDPRKIVIEGRKVDKEQDQKLSNILQPWQWAAYRRGKGR